MTDLEAAPVCHPPPVSPFVYRMWLLFVSVESAAIAAVAVVFPESFASLAYEWADTLMPVKSGWVFVYASISACALAGVLFRNNFFARVALGVLIFAQFTFVLSIALYGIEHRVGSAPIGSIQWATALVVSAGLLRGGAVVGQR